MKILCFILISSAPVFGQSFGDDNPTGDWLPTPDAYVWPAAAKGVRDFNPVQRKFSDLDKAKQKAIEAYWPEDDAPEHVAMDELDLNGDGRKEIFFSIPAYGGTGGNFYQVLTTKDGKSYQGVGGIGGWGVQFLKRKNGWVQIEAMSRGGGGHYTRYLMTFIGKKYQTSRLEDHDYNAKKATVREVKVKPEEPKRELDD